MRSIFLTSLIQLSFSTFGQESKHNISKFEILIDSNSNYTYTLENNGERLTATKSNGDTLWSIYPDFRGSARGKLCCMKFSETTNPMNNKEDKEKVIRMTYMFKYTAYVVLSNRFFYISPD